MVIEKGNSMVNSKKFSKWLYNPDTGEEIEINATTENALHNKCEKQIRTWEKERAERERRQYIAEQDENVRQLNEENERLIFNLRYHMLSYILQWSSYRYYERLKRKRRYSEISLPPTLKEINKELKVPWKIGVLEHFSEERKNRRIIAEKKVKAMLEKRNLEYSRRAEAYEKMNAEYNAEIDKRHDAFASGDPKETTDFFAWVIEQDCRYIQGYYIGFQPEEYLFYDMEKMMLAVDLKLPCTREVPNVKAYEYEEKNDSIKTKRMTQREFKLFYSKIICEIILRVIAVIYESDEYKLVDTIVMNGYREFLDRSRGKYINDCIISLEFSRKEFEELYLGNADGEAVIRRVCKNVPADFMAEMIHIIPVYESGMLNVYYVR